jgi:hypothetical protein
VAVEYTTIATRDPDRAEIMFRLRSVIDSLADASASSWWDVIKSQSTQRPFLAAMTGATMVARKPPRMNRPACRRLVEFQGLIGRPRTGALRVTRPRRRSGAAKAGLVKVAPNVARASVEVG